MKTFIATTKDQYIQEITLNPNTYTFQAYVKGSRFSIGFSHDDGLTWENHNLDWQVIADDFQHVKYTFTLNNRVTLFSLMNSEPATQVEIVAPFLELGTNASTPKPNELDGMETTENLINEAIIKATFWVINSSSPVIYKDSVNATTAGVHTPITIQGELKRGATTTVGGYLTITANGDTESTTALASPRTLSPSDIDGKTTYTIRLYDKATGGVLLDTMTIPIVFKGASGISALNAVLSNEADVLPSSADGLTTDFANSGTSVRVFEGSRELSYNKTVTSAGSYNVEAIGTNATPANPNYSTGGYCTYGDITAMDNDKATITFTIKGLTFENVAFTLIKKQSLSKSRIGANGQTSYLHIAYATSADGSQGFDVSVSTGKTYIGQYVDFDPEDSKDPKKYTWMLIKGADGNDTETYTLILSRTGVYDYETDSVKVDVLYTKGATSLMLDKNSALSRKTYVYVFDGKEAVSSGEGGTSIDVGSSYSFKALCPGGQYVTMGLIRNIGDSWTLLESKTISVVKGEDGNPAVNVLIHPSQVIVNTDDNGLVGTNSTLLANAKTTAVAYKAGVEVDCSINTVSTSTGISYSVTGKTLSVTEIKQDPDTKYAYASGWIDFMVTVDGIDYPQRLSVGTNIHAVIAQFIVDNESEHKSITASVTSVRDDAANDAQNKADAALDAAKTYTSSQLKITEGNIATKVEQSEYNENDQLLKSRMSTIEQKADSISLKVSETVLSGNMLKGTMFRKEEEVTWNNPSYKGVISTAVQLGGVNSVYLESTSETYVYEGVKWAKIPVTAGKTYNMSFWYRTPDAASFGAASNGHFAMEVQGFKANGDQAEAENFRPLVEWELPIPANDVWQLYKGSMPIAIDSDVAAVDVLIYLVTKGKMYVSRPMLIEGSYVGWQRSEQDYDYIGGNLLDETKTLTKRGNVNFVNDTVAANAVGVCASIYASATSGYTELIKWQIPYDLNTDYTLSFMAKGTGSVDAYLYNDNVDVSLFSETGAMYNAYGDGNVSIALTPEWKRHTVRWRTESARTLAWSYLLLRVFAVSEAYIAQPKLEKGCTATEWTEDDGDMVSTKALLATGIDIKSRKVTITSDNVQVQNNSGEPTLLLDKYGKIQTNLIVASVIKTGDIGRPHVEAKGSEFKIFGYEAFAFIEMAWREDVGSVLRFNDEKTGQALYDLGPGGILDNIATVPDKWTIMPLKSLTTSSRIAAILNVTENDCTPFYQFVEGYKQLNGMKQYNVSGTSSPSGYSGKMYVQQSYNSAVISDGWYVGVNNGNYMVAGASTSLYMCNLMSISNGKVTNSVVCYFTDADTSSLRAPKSVGRDKDGIALNQATYPYLWSYGVGLAE